MLMPHPPFLRELLQRYDALRTGDTPSGQRQRALDDVCYTLCVSTGTRSVEAALALAREIVAAAFLPSSTGPSTAAPSTAGPAA